MLGAAHEPFMDPIVALSSSYAHGWLRTEYVHTVLAGLEWPDIVVDYKHTELMSASAVLWPTTKYLVLVRNPADTVASMVNKGWYRPSDDAYPPATLFKVIADVDPQPAFLMATNDAGNRTRGDILGVDNWGAMTQVERCGWWWNHVYKTAYAFSSTNPGRVAWQSLETVTHNNIAETLFGRPFKLPNSNTSHATPVSGWEPYVEEMAGVLGYDSSR